MAKALRYMGDRDLSREMRQVTRSVAKVMQAEVKDRCPVNTGSLKKSIRVRATRTIARLIVGQPQGSYAWLVHRGTKYMPSRPFIREGVSAATPKMYKLYYEGHRKVAKKFNRKHAGKARPTYDFDKTKLQVVRRTATARKIKI